MKILILGAGQVGRTAAQALDTNVTSQRDLVVVIPLVLLVVLLILMVLLRSVLAPVLLVAATVLSFGTAMGVSALVFDHVLDDYDAPATWIPVMIGAIAAGATDYARQRNHSIR